MTKDMLIYTAFTVDALNTFVSFPLFAAKGPKWVLKSVPTKEEIPPSEVDRESFKLIWDLFMVCYEGYFGFTASTLVCIYRVPETIPIFAYSLFGLYAYKTVYLSKMYSKTKDDQTKAKLYSVLLFFLPCYGGYSALHLLECFRGR